MNHIDRTRRTLRRFGAARGTLAGEVWNAINKAVRISIFLGIGFFLGAALTHRGGWMGGTVFTLGTITVTRFLLWVFVIGGLGFLAIWTDLQAQSERWDQERARAEAERNNPSA